MTAIETRELIHDVLAGPMARIESQYDLLKQDTEYIKERVDKQNGRVDSLEDEVATLKLNEKSHIINCPVAPRAEILERHMQATITGKKIITWVIATTATLTGLIWTVYLIVSKLNKLILL